MDGPSTRSHRLLNRLSRSSRSKSSLESHESGTSQSSSSLANDGAATGATRKSIKENSGGVPVDDIQNQKLSRKKKYGLIGSDFSTFRKSSMPLRHSTSVASKNTIKDTEHLSSNTTTEDNEIMGNIKSVPILSNKNKNNSKRSRPASTSIFAQPTNNARQRQRPASTENPILNRSRGRPQTPEFQARAAAVAATTPRPASTQSRFKSSRPKTPSGLRINPSNDITPTPATTKSYVNGTADKTNLIQSFNSGKQNTIPHSKSDFDIISHIKSENSTLNSSDHGVQTHIHQRSNSTNIDSEELNSHINIKPHWMRYNPNSSFESDSHATELKSIETISSGSPKQYELRSKSQSITSLTPVSTEAKAQYTPKDESKKLKSDTIWRRPSISDYESTPKSIDTTEGDIDSSENDIMIMNKIQEAERLKFELLEQRLNQIEKKFQQDEIKSTEFSEESKSRDVNNNSTLKSNTEVTIMKDDEPTTKNDVTPSQSLSNSINSDISLTSEQNKLCKEITDFVDLSFDNEKPSLTPSLPSDLATPLPSEESQPTASTSKNTALANPKSKTKSKTKEKLIITPSKKVPKTDNLNTYIKNQKEHKDIISTDGTTSKETLTTHGYDFDDDDNNAIEIVLGNPDPDLQQLRVPTQTIFNDSGSGEITQVDSNSFNDLNTPFCTSETSEGKNSESSSTGIDFLQPSPQLSPPQTKNNLMLKINPLILQPSSLPVKNKTLKITKVTADDINDADEPIKSSNITSSQQQTPLSPTSQTSSKDLQNEISLFASLIFETRRNLLSDSKTDQSALTDTRLSQFLKESSRQIEANPNLTPSPKQPFILPPRDFHPSPATIARVEKIKSMLSLHYISIGQYQELPDPSLLKSITNGSVAKLQPGVDGVYNPLQIIRNRELKVRTGYLNPSLYGNSETGHHHHGDRHGDRHGDHHSDISSTSPVTYFVPSVLKNSQIPYTKVLGFKPLPLPSTVFSTNPKEKLLWEVDIFEAATDLSWRIYYRSMMKDRNGNLLFPNDDPQEGGNNVLSKNESDNFSSLKIRSYNDAIIEYENAYKEDSDDEVDDINNNNIKQRRSRSKSPFKIVKKSEKDLKILNLKALLKKDKSKSDNEDEDDTGYEAEHDNNLGVIENTDDKLGISFKPIYEHNPLQLTNSGISSPASLENLSTMKDISIVSVKKKKELEVLPNNLAGSKERVYMTEISGTTGNGIQSVLPNGKTESIKSNHHSNMGSAAPSDEEMLGAGNAVGVKNKSVSPLTQEEEEFVLAIYRYYTQLQHIKSVLKVGILNLLSKPQEFDHFFNTTLDTLKSSIKQFDDNNDISSTLIPKYDTILEEANTSLDIVKDKFINDYTPRMDTLLSQSERLMGEVNMSLNLRCGKLNERLEKLNDLHPSNLIYKQNGVLIRLGYWALENFIIITLWCIWVIVSFLRIWKNLILFVFKFLKLFF